MYMYKLEFYSNFRSKIYIYMYLKRHIEAVHEKIKNHVCRECGYAASRKDALKHHIEAVHENIKNHVCRECGYAASYNRENEKIKNHVSRKGKLK